MDVVVVAEQLARTPTAHGAALVARTRVHAAADDLHAVGDPRECPHLATGVLALALVPALHDAALLERARLFAVLRELHDVADSVDGDRAFGAFERRETRDVTVCIGDAHVTGVIRRHADIAHRIEVAPGFVFGRADAIVVAAIEGHHARHVR